MFAGESELGELRADLLSWYDEHRRDLPWRRKVRGRRRRRRRKSEEGLP